MKRSFVGSYLLALLTCATFVLMVAGCVGDGGSQSSLPQLTPGDPGRGEVVFGQSACTACHTFSGFDGRNRNVGPNLDLVASRYDSAFIRKSIVDPSAFVEQGSEGKIGGARTYSNSMPAYGPKELPPQHLTEQQLRDLVAFIEQGGTT